jgi:hypothetical protein
MHAIELYWTLLKSGNDIDIQRHCKNCGKTVLFSDTRIRRHNANGKNVFRFAIYKCEKGHSWNKKLAIYKSFSEHVEVLDQELPMDTISLTPINVEEYREKGIKEVTITIDHAEGRFRIDKLLAEQIVGWSRAQIAQKIKDGFILLNHAGVKSAATLADHDRITIMIE